MAVRQLLTLLSPGALCTASGVGRRVRAGNLSRRASSAAYCVLSDGALSAAGPFVQGGPLDLRNGMRRDWLADARRIFSVLPEFPDERKRVRCNPPERSRGYRLYGLLYLRSRDNHLHDGPRHNVT